MAYRVVDSEWKLVQVARAEGVLLAHMVRGQVYTGPELRQVLHLSGLDFSTELLGELLPDLLAGGKIEEV